MGVGFFISLGAVTALFARDAYLDRRRLKKKREKKCETEQFELQRLIEYNRTHLPSKELPPLCLDWDAVNGFIEETRFRLCDEGDAFLCWEYDKGTWRIPKSNLDGDTLKLIDFIKKDVAWFLEHPTGFSTGECRTVLEDYLREKYPLLSEHSLHCIGGRFCANNR